MRLLVTLFIFCFSILCAKSQPKAEDYFEWAEEKLMFEDTTGAIEALNSALNLHPLFYEAYLMRSKIYFDLKQYDKAREDIDFTFRLRDTVADAYYYRGRLRARNKEPRGAMLDFHKAIELDSVRPDYYLARAYQRFNMNLDRSSINSDFYKVLELDSNNLNALIFLGSNYLASDSLSEVFRLINIVRRLVPDSTLTNLEISMDFFEVDITDYTFLNINLSKPSIDNILKLLSKIDRSPFIFRRSFNAGFNYEELELKTRKPNIPIDILNKGLKYVDKVRRMNPDNYISRLILAAYFFDDADFKRSEAFVSEILLKDPSNIYAYFFKAQMNIALGKMELALIDVEKVLENNSNFAPIYIQRASINTLLLKPVLALNDYDRAIEINPSKCEYYEDKAWLLKALGKQEEAIALLNSREIICQNYAANYLLRGLCKRDIRQFQSACDDFRTSSLLGNFHARFLIEQHCKRYPAQE